MSQPASGSSINKTVFIASSVIILCITCFGSVWPKLTELFFKQIQNWLVVNTSWIYILIVGSLLFFSLWLMMSRMGDIKLGPDGSTPDYSNFSWFAMLFSAGMGIGLLFFGVAEPVMHLSAPPTGDPLTIESAQEAMKITFFHWGLHAWAIYAVFAVTLAYFSYRKNLPLLPRSAFYPFLGEKIHGSIGDIIDTFCVIGTMFGVATSLGFGVTQVNAGLSYLFDVPQNVSVQVLLIAAITTLATVSVVLGLDGGIKRLSNLNLILAVFLLVFILLLGDTALLMKSFVENTGAYLSDIVHKTFNLYAYEKKESWIGGWTLLYWGWWVSWAPFVGMFIARISRGRSIRQFISGVLFIPAGFTFLWMTVFGNTALSFILKGKGQELLDTVNSNVPVALFKFFEFFPFSTFLSLLGLLLVITFFVSSSDSGSLVIDTLASGGSKQPPVWQRIYWALLEGVVAAVLLYAGGLDALQTMTIASAFPMSILIVVAVLAFIRALREDQLRLSSIRNPSLAAPSFGLQGNWKDRLDSVITHPIYSQALDFLKNTVEPGLRELNVELTQNGYETRLDTSQKGIVKLVVKNEGVENFNYGIRLQTFSTPDYVPEDENIYYRAEVFLIQGSQEYDVYGFTKEQVIADAITHFKKHLHFLHLNHSEKL